MFFLYVDESGDSGLSPGASPYFVLSGVVIHELRWNEYLDQIVAFRKRMRSAFGLLLREEIHAARLLNRPGPLVRIKRNDRLSIIRHFTNEIVGMSDLTVINVVVNKSTKALGYDVLENAWQALIQRFSNTLSHRNFNGPANTVDYGMVVPDMSDTKRITQILRKMRRFNPVPHRPGYGPGYRNLQIKNLVEDPYFKNSEHSYFIQVADLCAFNLYQHIAPSAFIKTKAGHGYFSRMDPILCKVASTTDPHGIVRL